MPYTSRKWNDPRKPYHLEWRPSVDEPWYKFDAYADKFDADLEMERLKHRMAVYIGNGWEGRIVDIRERVA